MEAGRNLSPDSTENAEDKLPVIFFRPYFFPLLGRLGFFKLNRTRKTDENIHNPGLDRNASVNTLEPFIGRFVFRRIDWLRSDSTPYRSARFFQGTFNALRCHGKLEHFGPRGIIDRCGQYAAHANNGRLATAFRCQCRIRYNHGFDFGKP